MPKQDYWTHCFCSEQTVVERLTLASRRTAEQEALFDTSEGAQSRVPI
jgi:hypothetical protein